METDFKIARGGAGRPAFYEERADALSKAQMESIPASIIILFSATVIAFDNNAPMRSIGWFICMVILSGCRYSLSKRYQLREPKTLAQARRYLGLALGSAVVAGIGYAYIPAFLMPVAADSELPLIILIAGVAAGAVVQSTSYKPVSIVINVPMLLTHAALLAQAGGRFGLINPFNIALYLLFNIVTAIRLEKAFLAQIALSAKGYELAASLETERAAAQAAAVRLYQVANQDSLTGLGNRAAFTRDLEDWITMNRKNATAFHLLLIDLDEFKSINDKLGHAAGDQILVAIGNRLRQVLTGNHMAARLGGDEFAVLVDVSDGGGEASISGLADKLMATVSGPCPVDGGIVDIALSVGIAAFPSDGGSFNELLAHADLALYAVKANGRSSWRLFDQSLLNTSKMMRDIELDLPGAIASKQLEVWFQPQVNMMSGEVAGLEALLRWNHPVRGWISPPEIVAAAFRLRISNSLTAFVLEQACRKIRDLTASGHGEVRVAINISPRELVQYDVARLVKKSILEHGVSPDRLEIEITEETIANSAMALATFDSLTKFGIRIAIDDFGIGFSSITYLRTMQIHQIKIDRSFVSSIATNPRDRIIVRTIIGLGQSFGLDVIAEGVETQEEAEILQTLGCRTLQGFYIADPMSSSKLSDWLRAPKMSLALSEAAA